MYLCVYIYTWTKCGYMYGERERIRFIKKSPIYLKDFKSLM